MASCSGTGGVVVCNGQVVYVASSAADAGQWYVSHLDVQFDTSKLMVTATGSCTGNTCEGKTTASCSASPGPAKTSGGGLLLAAMAFVGVAATRRRKVA
jgi:MYXO-CTERM domain-containing protein